jgi:uncharacterized lipoprotein YddW (UPF0748 family)
MKAPTCFLVAAAALLAPAAGRALPPAEPAAGSPDEVRAIWVTRWDWKTEDQVRQAIRWCAAIGLNRVFFQVRGRADAFYRSNLEPWGEEIGGRDPGYDPLETAIAAARAAGIELHAWINVLPAWKGAEDPRDPRHLLHRHPEWFLVERSGRRRLKDAADYTILNPCLPEVRAYLVEVVKDIVERYPIAGLHLDYIRFIARPPGAGHDVSYDPRTLALFRKYSGTSPFDDPAAWDRWRALSVDTLVYRIAEAARARPGLQLSVAAIADLDRARTALFQDVPRWQARGWIDEVYPMTYERDAPGFAYRAAAVLTRCRRDQTFPGIGVHLFRSAGELSEQLEATRALGAGGYSLFAFANFFPSPSHESRNDPESKRLRAAMRATLLALNGGPQRREPQGLAGESAPPAIPEAGAPGDRRRVSANPRP